jgi:penicillin-binding protein 1C
LIIIFSCLITTYIFILPRQLFTDPISTVILDKDEILLGAHIAADGQWRFPQSDTIPEKFAKSLISFEDKRFNRHFGIDIIAFGRALWQNISQREIVSGGSTITMQVIRLSRKGKSRTVLEKIWEIILATRLEFSKSKEEIMILYASNAPFGGNVVGLEAAAWRYFGTTPENLSWAESSMLAVLPNSPALIHPGKNRDELLEKRNKLLLKLYQNQIINQETYELAIEEEIPEKPIPFPEFAPHLLSHIENETVITSKIKTTIEIELQKKVNKILEEHYKTLSGNGINNAAAIVLEVKTGNIKAYFGNFYSDENKSNENYVDNIIAPRSTGSILKPFLYAAMLTSGEIMPNSLVADVPTYIAGYSPQNYNLTYDGAVPASRALAKSLNVPAVKMLQSYGVEKFHYILQKTGMTTLPYNPDHYGLSLILGGCEGELWELTGIYASMARTLIHYQDYSGKYDKSDYFEPNFLNPLDRLEESDEYMELSDNSWFSASAIYTTFNAMLEVERPEEENLWDLFSSSKKIAWKTGTSFGFRDAWAIGITPDYVVGVWVGNSDGEGRPELIGIKSAAPILFEIFNLLPENSEWFEMPYDDMIKLNICVKSGYIASEICDETDSLWVPKNCERFEICPYHQLIHLDKNEEFQVTSDCESTSTMVHKSWFVLPPVMEWYYKQKNATYLSPPPFRNDCINSAENSEQILEIIYPNYNTKIFVPVDLDGQLSSTVFEAVHRDKTIKVFWYIDEKYMGQTEGSHKMSFQPTKGEHVLTLTDENGVKITRFFEVLNK